MVSRFERVRLSEHVKQGTSLQGYATVPLTELSAVLGPPFEVQEPLDRSIWVWEFREFVGGGPVALYNLNGGVNWHVSAHDLDIAERFLRWLELELREIGRGDRDIVCRPWLLPPGVRFHKEDPA